MSFDTWLDGGFGGEARRQYDERLSRRPCTHTQNMTRTHEAELAQVEREAVALRERLGLNQTLLEQ